MPSKGRNRPQETFAGSLPEIRAGEVVWCRDALGRGWVKRVALDAPRYDQTMAYRLCWLTVPTATIEDYREHGPDAPFVNWPATDVERADNPVPGALWFPG